jgi:hypothetical protein
MGTGRTFGDKTTKCIILGLAHLLIFAVGVGLNDFHRPGRSWKQTGIMIALGLVVVACTTFFSAVVEHEAMLGGTIMMIYSAAMTALVWCTDTGVIGFSMCGQVGLVFLVLVYYNRLATKFLEYKCNALSQENEQLIGETI